MTLRKQLIGMILLTVALSVALNTFISGGYIDTYFRGYIQTQYDQHIEKISDYASGLLSGSQVLPAQAAADLNRFLEDPIIQIRVLTPDGRELLRVGSDNVNMHNTMMRGRRFQAEEDTFALQRQGQTMGYMVILRNGNIQSSESVLLFKSALRMGGLISSAVVLLVAILFTTWISRRMTKDLKRTAEYASAIQTGHEDFQHHSKTLEISAIQLSLQDLSTKLRLQQQVQKEKADQLAHEARTPLTLLKTHVEGVMDGVIDMDPSRLESCLHEIDALTQVISHINQVIDHKDEGLVPNLEHFDLTVETKKIIKGMKLQFEQKQLGLSLESPGSLPLYNDPILMSQVLYNLLTNAYKFTPEGGQVTVTLRQSGALCVIEVCDTGLGIDANQIDQLFKPYYRDPAVRHLSGEGLGLFIARRNAEALGGSLTAARRPEGGSCFTFSLPVKFDGPTEK